MPPDARVCARLVPRTSHHVLRLENNRQTNDRPRMYLFPSVYIILSVSVLLTGYVSQSFTRSYAAQSTAQEYPVNDGADTYRPSGPVGC